MADETVVSAGGGGVSLRTIGWGAFLGASWTWCIGMFLPVLLVRDYGLWAWFVFAIPNVVGAAAMGWVLRDADASLRLQTKHLPAVVAFSLVTIAFHVFFLFCVIGPIAQSWFVLPIAMLAMLLAWLLSHHVHAGWLIAAAIAIPGHDPFRVFRRDKCSLDADGIRAAGRHKKHVAIAEQRISAVLIDDGA